MLIEPGGCLAGILPSPSPQSSHIFFGCSSSPSAVCPFVCTAPLRLAPCSLACPSCPPLCTPISGGCKRGKLLGAIQGKAAPSSRIWRSQSSSHLLCDKFVDILVLRQEFLPAQAPVPPQLARGLLALQENLKSALSTTALHPAASCPGSHIQQWALPTTVLSTSKRVLIPSMCQPQHISWQLCEQHALTMPLHNKPSTSTSSVVAFPRGTRGFVISL